MPNGTVGGSADTSNGAGIMRRRPIDQCHKPLVQSHSPALYTKVIASSRPPDTVSNHSTPLLDLPDEILRMIFDHLIGGSDAKFNVTTGSVRPDDTIPRAFEQGYPANLRVLETLSSALPLLREVIAGCLGTKTFRNHNGDSLFMTWDLIEPIMCARIRRFEFRFDYHMKVNHQRYWPVAFEFLVERLLNLEWLGIFSLAHANQGVYPPQETGDTLDSITRAQQEERALCRFAAFAVHMHPRLNIVYRTARCGKPIARNCTMWEYVVQKHRPRVWKKAPESTDILTNTAAEAVRPAVGGDKIINAAAVREMLWIEAFPTDVDILTLKPGPSQSPNDITTSNVMTKEHLRYFGEVNEKGHRLMGEYEVTSVNNDTIEVDRLIEAARTRKAKDSVRATRVPLLENVSV